MASELSRWPGKWFRVALSLPRPLEDDVVGRLLLGGGEGASSRPGGPRRVVLDAWFAEETRARAAAAGLALLPGVRILTRAPEIVTDPGWLEAGLRRRAPVNAGPFVVVVERPAPRGHRPGRIQLVLPPGRAFGTGEHATTRMCLILLARWLAPGGKVLDFGAGSGILAIAAARAGASSVLAVDHDDAVLDVARENVRINGVIRLVTVRGGSWDALPTGRRFDVILANIHRTALVRGARALASRVNPGGCVILSGFATADAPEVLAAWKEQGFSLAGRRRRGEWAALVVRRPGGVRRPVRGRGRRFRAPGGRRPAR